MPVLRSVMTLVFSTIAAVDVDVSVTLGEPALTTPFLAMTVDVPVPVGPVASSGRAAPASTVAPMAAAAFAVAVVPMAPVLPDPAPTTLVL